MAKIADSNSAGPILPFSGLDGFGPLGTTYALSGIGLFMESNRSPVMVAVGLITMALLLLPASSNAAMNATAWAAAECYVIEPDRPWDSWKPWSAYYAAAAFSSVDVGASAFVSGGGTTAEGKSDSTSWAQEPLGGGVSVSDTDGNEIEAVPWGTEVHAWATATVYTAGLGLGAHDDDEDATFCASSNPSQDLIALAEEMTTLP